MLSRATAALPWCPPHLKKDRCSTSDTKVGVLTTITVHVPTPPEGSMYRHRRRVTQPRGEKPLTYPETSHPHTRDAPKRVSVIW
ncbi:hypothetical protein AVEN_135610-1 [Araneus ventricosus]|uniref:Uncharacterized protein n=1 Tax=Araneus ventricosus TaxID=182803 RepID=A0A4Y2DSV6_ARAVE|nr:hypothetical protein AVEN_135610-1 [Araneus ventricosus]